MDREQELGFVRRAYAREIMARAGVSDPRVETAFAELRREDFLGPGPWLVVGSLGDYPPSFISTVWSGSCPSGISSTASLRCTPS